MAETLDRVVTTSGDTWEQREDSLGRTYHVQEGEGRKTQQQYAAAKSHSGAVEAFGRGNYEPDSVDELGHPYDAKTTDPVNRYERGSQERREAAEINRWLGFRYDENTPDDPIEAAKEYYEMKQELEDADTPEEEQDVKQQYNIGGS